MHPDVKTLEWIQCDRCNKWLHSDCAGIDAEMVTEDMPFNCGCDIDQSYSYNKYVLYICKQTISTTLQIHSVFV